MARKRSSPKTDLVLWYLAANPAATTSQVVTDLKAHGISESLVAKVRQGRRRKRGAKKGLGRETGGQSNAAARMVTAVAWADGATGSTKADLIRETAGAMEKPVRPKDVVAALAAKGIEVSFPHVAKVLTSMGMKKRIRRRKAAAVGAAAVAASSSSLSIDDLVAAKKLVGQVGSIEKVKEALTALARLS
ncbi:MAG TPA: hypothetical protein VGX76_16425 [Pirellulales bacterium]|nr:hypothetical protein [Pirellulales bacterium]